MNGRSAAGAGIALGMLLTVGGLVAVVLGVVSATLALDSGASVAGVGPGLAAAFVLVGLSLLAMGGTLVFGVR